MVNGAAALGILSGGAPGSTPSLSALNLFRQINKNEVKLRENYFNRNDVQQSIETFRAKVSKMEDIDELIKDRKSLQFLLSSFDLDSEINNAGKIKAILKSDVNDQNSFANRLNDKRFAELAKFVNLNKRGLTNLRTASSQQNLIDKFLQNTFEKDVSGQNPDIAKAFHFLRNINNVSTTASLLGTLQLREIVTTALRLPQEIARQSIEKQISMVEAKFDVEKAVIPDKDTGISNRRQNEYKDDIQAIEIAKSQVTSAESTLSTLEKQLKQARESLDLLPEIISPEGFNVDLIPIHQTAIKQLSEINGVTASAQAALSELDPILRELNSSIQELLDVETQDDLDNIKVGFAAAAAKVPDLIYHTARFKEPDTGSNINLFKPSGGVVDSGSPNSYAASRINYPYQDGTLENNPITTLSGTLGSNPYTVQSGALGADPYTIETSTLGADPFTVQSDTLGSNPYTLANGTLGSNPFTVKGGALHSPPFRYQAGDVTNDGAGNAVIRIRSLNHGLEAGDTISISGTSNFLGVDVNGTYTVHSVRGIHQFRIALTGIDFPDPTGTLQSGGGSSGVLKTNRVSVTHNGHPFSNGDTATFSGGASVGGESLNGNFTVANATTNSYEFLLGSNATANTTGGGGSVTVNASDQVTVAHTGHPFSNGDTVTFSGGSSVGGASLNGSFTVANATANSYTVTSTSQGIAGTGGGGSVTVNASDQVTVAHTGHPFSNGDTVTFSGGSSVGGASLNGSFTVANATANSYTVTSTSQGIAGTGGGGSVTVNASDQVTVAQEDHLFSVGDFVTLSNIASVGGLNLTGTFEVASVTDDAYVITVGSQAIAGQAGGGNSANYSHTLGPNPFSTTSGSAVVSVADNSHGLSVGDVVQFDNSSAVGGLDLNAAFRVSSVTDANNYTITATSTATGTIGGGGGNGVGLTLPELASVIDDKNSTIIAQNKDMATFVSKIASAAAIIAGTTLANVVSDTGSAKSDLDDANTEFRQARGVVDANSNSFASQTNSITFAATLNTTELTKGRESILDAISRLEKIATDLRSIDRYATETFSSDNATSYAAARADIVSLLDNAGKIVGSTSGSLASDPFQTQSGNNQVTVAQSNHGLAVGDSVSYSGAASVGGLDLNSSFTVTNVTDANTYTITASTNASANATGGGASVSFLGSPSVTLDNLLAISGTKTYRIRDGVNQFIASNPGLDDIDASGPYAINDSARFNSLLPSTLTSGNQVSAASGNATFLENVKTAIKQLQRDLPVFDFVTNTADPLGAVDAQVTNIKENIDKIFKGGNSRGLNLIDTSARDLSIALGSVGKKITISAQNQIKGSLREAIENYTYSALDGGQSGDLGANPFTTVAGETSILVSHTAHGFTVGEYVQFSNGDNVGGLNLDTTFQITSIPDDNSYTITASAAASSSATGGGASVSFKTIPTARHKFLFDAHFDVSRSFGKLRTERLKLNVEEALLRAEFNKPMEVESQFLKPLQNTDYAVKFIEKYLLIKDLQSTGVTFRPTNNNALALNLIKSINPNRGIGLSVNMLR